MSNFFQRFFKKKPTQTKPKQRPVRTYTDTSSLAGIEKASRTSKPTFFGDLAMGLGFKEKDTSFKIRTLKTIERNKKKKEKEAAERKAKGSDRDKDRKATTSGGGGTSVAPPPKPKTQEELYAEMLARELEARRKAGQEARRKYERRVGEEVAARRKKVQLLLL